MKTLITVIALFFLALVARGQSIITATVTVTNQAGTTNGQTITVNGSLRIFTNNPTTTSQILTATNITLAKSNLFVAYLSFPQSGLTISQSSTNKVVFQSFPGQALTVSISTNWGTLALTTNSISGTNSGVVRFPKTIVGVVEQTNVENALVDYLSDNKATSSIPSSAPIFANFASAALLYTVGQNCTNFALLVGLGGSNNVYYVSNILATLVRSSTNGILSAAYQPLEFFQPASANLTNWSLLSTSVISAGLSYLEGNDVVLRNADNTIRFEAVQGGVALINYEDGVLAVYIDASHNIFVRDHAGTSRIEIDDAAGNIFRGSGGQNGMVQSADGKLTLLDPLSMNMTAMPLVASGVYTNFIADANNSGTSETSVNAFNIPANAMATNGDTVTRSIAVSLSSGTSSKRTRVYFGGNTIFDTTALANTGAGSHSIHVEVTRTGSTTFRYNCFAVASATTTTDFSSVGSASLSSGDFTSAQDFHVSLTVTGTGAGSSQATVILDNTEFKPSSSRAQ